MKKKVAIIGVTGSVGQEFVQSLHNHPWFEVTQIAASERTAGKKYLDAIRDANGIVAWDVGGEIPEYIKQMTVLTIDEVDISQLVLIFSAVESVAARDIETKFAKDLPVISTSSAYRYEEDVQFLSQVSMTTKQNFLKFKRRIGIGKVGLLHYQIVLQLV